ncbi:MAG: hypothetical protein OEZ54_12615 [Gemmatimonadota bacterium]|nr:hypothetical protein [Gemmatimonadota bacterium]
MDTYLLLSNPPHSGPDVSELSQMFGIAIAEAQAKVNAGVPEIWFANTEAGPLTQMASTLESMGLNTRIVNGSILGMTPGVDKLISFGFKPEGFECTTVGGVSFVAPYDAHTVLAMLKPGDGKNEEVAAMTQSGSVVTLAGILDIYFVFQGRIRRATVHPQTTDFSGLEGGERETAQENHSQLIEQMRAKFSDIVVDERLVDVPIPRHQMIGSGSVKGILNDINPELVEITPPDLQSRLAFLSSV